MQEVTHKSKGIVCKVWNIKADTKSKSASSNLGDSIQYITNSEKTDLTMEMPDAPFHDAHGQVGRELHYVMNDIKTLEGVYVGGRNIRDINNARNEMMEVTNFFNKGNNPQERVAQHMIISLPASESGLANCKNLMLLASDALSELFPNHQSIYAIHVNTDNLHIHVITNATGLDGKKIHEPRHWIEEVLQPCINKYAKKYGFTQNEAWLNHSKNYKQRFVELKISLREMVDKAIENSDSIQDFKRYMEQNFACTVNIGRHISLQTDDMAKAMRSHQLGSNYTPEAIAKRIQNRKADFEVKEIDAYGYEGDLRDTITFTPKEMKNYKDMTKEEKKEVVHMLRLKRNPWREYKEDTWQIQKTVDNINRKNKAVSLIRYYAPSGNVDDALAEIIELKKQISKEKKEAKTNFHSYKAVIDIYKEMQECEVRAYLYEHQDCKQYRADFDRYRELTYRLKDGYGKTVNEVAEFIEEQSDYITYANAQINELQSQYRTIVNYAKEEGIQYVKSDKQSVYEAMEQWELMHNAREHHTYKAEIFYLVSKNNSKECIRVQTSFKNVNDRVMEVIEATLVDDKGNVLEKRNSLEDGMNNFNNWIFSLSGRGFDDCKKYTSLKEVKDTLSHLQAEENANQLMAEQKKKEDLEKQMKIAFEKMDRQYQNQKSYSFAQAINYGTTHNKFGNHIVVNPDDMSNVLIVNTMPEKGLMLSVINKDGAEQYNATLPPIHDKKNSGWKTMCQIQDGFNFSDRLIVFETYDAYEQYKKHMQEAEEKENAKKKHIVGR